MGKVEAETLVLAPYPDAAVPAEHSRELAAAIPNSSYTEIDSGHMVIFERPAELVQLIQDFIHRA